MQREFIANVTHELKTPIALIQGYAEGLQDGIAQDADSRDFYTGVILDEAGKMNKMVQKLLTLTHLEFGSEKAEMTRFDAAQLILSELSSAVLLANENESIPMKPAEFILIRSSHRFMCGRMNS